MRRTQTSKDKPSSGILMGFYLQRRNALSQSHFPNSFLKNAEFKFALFQILYEVMSYGLLHSDAFWNSKQMKSHVKITD